eukprot:6204678-Pleurochrysis_carterae.AAC.8
MIRNSVDNDGGTTRLKQSERERFTFEGYGPVCSEYCRRAYGIHQYTWNTFLGRARAGVLVVDEDSYVTGVDAAMRKCELVGAMAQT